MHIIHINRKKAQENRFSTFHLLLTDLRKFAALRALLISIVLFCETCWLVYLTETDIARYHCYALTFWLGSSATKLLPTQCAFLLALPPQPAFHMLPLEYPPLTLLLFSLPLLVPLPYYTLTFALFMLCIAALICWLLTRYGPRGSTTVFALYLGLGACATAQFRFDLFPAMCTLLCVIAAERQRWTTAYVILAFSVLLKLYPIVLLPVLFLAEQQAYGHASPTLLRFRSLPQHIWQTLHEVRYWQWKHCLIFLSILLGVSGGFALLNVQGALLSSLSYFTQRPIQVESVESTFLWMAHLRGVPWHIVFTYASLNTVSSLSPIVSIAGTGCSVLACLAILWLQWRKKMDLVQASVALLLVLLTTGKVFSPQYLIWLIPLLAYMGASSIFWWLCWGGMSILTTFIYGVYYSQLPNPQTAPQVLPTLPGFFQLVSVRNGLLLFTTLAYLFNWFHARQRQPLLPVSEEDQHVITGQTYHDKIATEAMIINHEPIEERDNGNTDTNNSDLVGHSAGKTGL